MTTLDLTHLETLLAAATPGPWYPHARDEHDIEDSDGLTVAGNYHYEEGGVCRQEDRDLIVALRNAAPALIARVRELENPQIASVIDLDTGFTINGPEWLQLPLKARLIIQELSLQNDALKAEQEWQDMESAPKDGTKIVALGFNWGNPDGTRHSFITRYREGDWIDCQTEGHPTTYLRHLTHWKHLPKPPTE